MTSDGKPDTGHGASLGLARYLAWVFLVLILCFAVALASIFGKTARETLLSKQRDFAAILAENLNHQIFVRFTLPTVIGSGGIALRQPAQYTKLDQVVQSLIHGLHVQSLRIFDPEGIVTYSVANREEAGSDTLVSASVRKVMETNTLTFDLDTTGSWWEEFFTFQVKPGSYYLRITTTLRTAYPVRIEGRGSSSAEPESGRVLGVLEVIQDISGDMEAVVRFQWIIIGTTVISSLMLFWLFMVFLRRAEAALAVRVTEEQRLLSELHQHEKLAGMGRVVAGIAHEIRNPLGIIRSSAELLLRRPQSQADPLTSKILQAIFDESRRLSQTVSDFLDYARPRQPQQNQVDMEQVLSDVFTFIEPELAQHEILVVRDLPGDGSLLVKGDKDLLYRAFYNILMNAVQAMKGDGTLRISCEKVFETVPPTLEIVCSDSGSGFPAEDRERLLDPFVTTKDGGTGLGLPIVHSIITSHGGTMVLEDAPNGGGQVRVMLPVWE